jgi:hypothetical protein
MINREMDYKQKYILRNVANWYFVAPKYTSYNYVDTSTKAVNI